MKRVALAVVLAALIGLIFVLFTTAHGASDGGDTAARPASRDSVTAGGITLTSARIEEPEDLSAFTGPDADLLTARCTACHSPSMPLLQPKLDLAHWTAEVVKMRDVYGATVPPEEVDRIAQALVALQAAPTQ